MMDHYLVLFRLFGYMYMFSADVAFVFRYDGWLPGVVPAVWLCLPVLFRCCLCLQGTMDDFLKLFLQFRYIYLFSSGVAFVFTV